MRYAILLGPVSGLFDNLLLYTQATVITASGYEVKTFGQFTFCQQGNSKDLAMNDRCVTPHNPLCFSQRKTHTDVVDQMCVNFALLWNISQSLPPMLMPRRCSPCSPCMRNDVRPCRSRNHIVSCPPAPLPELVGSLFTGTLSRCVRRW